jgi:hypothetical protein
MSYSSSALQLFHSLGTNVIDHSGRNLSVHLLGTFELLKNWQFPENVALAGLFHSILGTSQFSERALRLHQHPELRIAIGESAYHLVKIFSIMERPAHWSVVLSDRKAALVHGGCAAVTIDDAFSLLSIEYANLVEQKRSSALANEIGKLVIDTQIPEHLSGAVRNSWGRHRGLRA